jgi:hypothetical protein
MVFGKVFADFARTKRHHRRKTGGGKTFQDDL